MIEELVEVDKHIWEELNAHCAEHIEKQWAHYLQLVQMRVPLAIATPEVIEGLEDKNCHMLIKALDQLIWAEQLHDD